MALSACAQELNFASMLLESITEVQNPLVMYEDNPGVVFLANNRQVGMHTKHIDIFYQFLRDMVEDTGNNINYIRSEENLAYIMIKNCSEADLVKHMKRITEG